MNPRCRAIDLASCSVMAHHYPVDTRSMAAPRLSRFAPRAGLVPLCQTFVRWSQKWVAWAANHDAAGRERVPPRHHLKVPTMQKMPAAAPSANAITATLAPSDRTPTVLGNCRPRLVGARYTIVGARAPAFRAPLARLARLRQLRLLREREHRQQRNRTDDDQYFHYISFAKAATTSPPQGCLKRSQRRSSQSAEQLCRDLRRSPRQRLASIAPRSQPAARRRRRGRGETCERSVERAGLTLL